MSELNDNPKILIARGTQETVARAAEVLSQLDVEVGFVPDEQHEQIDNVLEIFNMPGYYRFNKINNPKQWLGREHVLAFHGWQEPQYDRKIASQVFNALVAPAIRSKQRNQHANYHPIDPKYITQSTGLIISSRKQVNFPPLSHIHFGSSTPPESVKRVVQVGSLLKFHALLETNHALSDRLHALHNPDSSKRQFLQLLINQLTTQIEG